MTGNLRYQYATLARSSTHTYIFHDACSWKSPVVIYRLIYELMWKIRRARYNHSTVYCKCTNFRQLFNLDLYAAASTTTLQHYLDASKCTLAHSIFLDQHPAHLQSLNWFNSGGTTRSCVRLPLARSTLFVNSPFFSSYSTWLQLPPSVRQAPDMPKFRTLVRQHFSISQ